MFSWIGLVYEMEKINIFFQTLQSKPHHSAELFIQPQDEENTAI